MVLILEPVKIDVKKINIIGKKLTKIKNINFLSFGLILNFIFFVKNKIKNINGDNIPICFIKKIIGYLIWSITSELSKPVLANP